MVILKSPYGEENSEYLDSIYLKYCNDPKAIIDINSVTFYKIVQLIQLKTNKTLFILAVDSRLKLNINDTLIDEKGNLFTIKGFEMIRFSANVFHKWYLKITFVSIIGDIKEIGEYIALSDNHY